jgi:3-dehydroquinate synthase
MKELEIKSGGRVISKIFAGAGISEVVDCFEGTETVYIVCDRKVESLAGSIASSINASGINHSGTLHVAGIMPVEVSEDLKTMETVLRINDRLLEMNADRNSFLLAVGGGITTDMAGFAASIYKRGIRFAFVLQLFLHRSMRLSGARMESISIPTRICSESSANLNSHIFPRSL